MLCAAGAAAVCSSPAGAFSSAREGMGEIAQFLVVDLVSFTMVIVKRIVLGGRIRAACVVVYEIKSAFGIKTGLFFSNLLVIDRYKID